MPADEVFIISDFFDFAEDAPIRNVLSRSENLHREAFCAEDRLLAMRYLHHYYDLYCMMQTEVKDNVHDAPDYNLDKLCDCYKHM